MPFTRQVYQHLVHFYPKLFDLQLHIYNGDISKPMDFNPLSSGVPYFTDYKTLFFLRKIASRI